MSIKSHKMRKKERLERTKEMVLLYKNDSTLQEIGDKFNITRYRVRQLLLEAGVSGEDSGIKKERAKRKKILLEKITSKRDAKYLKKYGCTYNEKFELYGSTADNQSIHHLYTSQQANAKKRGIEWDISLTQWFDVWTESGKWEERGQGLYVMGRYNDTGSYEVGNVKIITAAQNAIEYQERKHGKSYQETLDKLGIERVN